MGDDRIRCTGRVTVSLDGHDIEVFGNEGWQDPTPLTKIVGRDVTGWQIESSHCFLVTLTDGAIIRLWSEDSPYENIIIRPGGARILSPRN